MKSILNLLQISNDYIENYYSNFEHNKPNVSNRRYILYTSESVVGGSIQMIGRICVYIFVHKINTHQEFFKYFV